jgi:uncharacterized protein
MALHDRKQTVGWLRDELGLHSCSPMFAQPAFYIALAAGPAFVVALWTLLPGALPATRSEPRVLLSLLLWQPLVEELLFRGLLQEHLSRRLPGSVLLPGLSRSNLLTSLLFATAHLLLHSPVWAAAALVPSLVYGYFKDRYGSILPALLLHVTYNACYFLPG